MNTSTVAKNALSRLEQAVTEVNAPGVSVKNLIGFLKSSNSWKVYADKDQRTIHVELDPKGLGQTQSAIKNLFTYVRREGWKTVGVDKHNGTEEFQGWKKDKCELFLTGLNLEFEHTGGGTYEPPVLKGWLKCPKSLARLELSMSYILEDVKDAPLPIRKVVKALEKEFRANVTIYTPISVDPTKWMLEPRTRVKKPEADAFIAKVKDAKIEGVTFSSSMIGNQFVVKLK